MYKNIINKKQKTKAFNTLNKTFVAVYGHMCQLNYIKYLYNKTWHYNY